MNRTLKKELVRLTSRERLYETDLPMIGLTGGIATGKTTVSKILKSQGFAIIDADQMVKSIYQTQAAKDFIRNNFPIAWELDQINFSRLRNLFFNNLQDKATIERFIYQRLPEQFRQELSQINEQTFCFYDVPLLFEKGLEQKMDLSIVVYAPREQQLQRLVSRDNNSTELAKSILDQQMDIDEKRKKADFVIDNSGSEDKLAAEVQRLLLQLLD